MLDGGGGGQPVALLHGGGRDLHDRDDVGALLATLGHRVAVVDLRGHGRTPRAPWTRELALRDVAAVAAALDLERPAVVGHSMGGMVAALWAAGHPECPLAADAIDELDLPQVYRAATCPLLVTRGRQSMAGLPPGDAQQGWLGYETWVRDQLGAAAAATPLLDVEWTDTAHDVHLEAPETVAQLVDRRLAPDR